MDPAETQDQTETHDQPKIPAERFPLRLQQR